MKYLLPFTLFLFGCGGGGVATRSSGNISIHTGDSSVVTISHTKAEQAAEKTIDAIKAAASAAQAQGGNASGGSAEVNDAAAGQD